MTLNTKKMHTQKPVIHIVMWFSWDVNKMSHGTYYDVENSELLNRNIHLKPGRKKNSIISYNTPLCMDTTNSWYVYVC